jgi:hypothetical protein
LACGRCVPSLHNQGRTVTQCSRVGSLLSWALVPTYSHRMRSGRGSGERWGELRSWAPHRLLVTPRCRLCPVQEGSSSGSDLCQIAYSEEVGEQENTEESLGYALQLFSSANSMACTHTHGHSVPASPFDVGELLNLARWESQG